MIKKDESYAYRFLSSEWEFESFAAVQDHRRPQMYVKDACSSTMMGAMCVRQSAVTRLSEKKKEKGEKDLPQAERR
jgi:hypothetical protein